MDAKTLRTKPPRASAARPYGRQHVVAPHLAGLVAAFRFLTSLPLPSSHETAAHDLRHALPYFPLIGLALGGLLVGLDHLLSAFIARPLVDFVLLASLLLLSGGLHFDGLVDTADGLLGPGPAHRRLETMRESWVGSLGVATGLAQLLLLYVALTALPSNQRVAALLLAPILGRWAIVYGYVALPYARRTATLSLALKRGATIRVGAATTIFVLLVAGLLSWPSGPLIMAFVWVTTAAVGRLAQARLGGMTGDVYGAVEQTVETLTLLLVPPFALGFHGP
jgi:adenosylcobinamide-GDP ribazoletransferase